MHVVVTLTDSSVLLIYVSEFHSLIDVFQSWAMVLESTEFYLLN